MADIETQTRDQVTFIVINRPGAMNSLTVEMHDALQDALDDFAADDRQRVCVLTGAGDKAFCAGSDLKASPESMRPYPRHGYAGIVERFDLNKPLIAAVNGVALGGGFEIALACDIILAVEDASFGLPEPRVGATALAGGMHRLQRQIGLKRAMGLALTGRSLSAPEAVGLGLVNELVPRSDLGAAIDRWCKDILRCAPLAVRATKEVMMQSLDESHLASALRRQNESAAFRAVAGSEDLKEGVRAFAERRPPIWRGR